MKIPEGWHKTPEGALDVFAREEKEKNRKKYANLHMAIETQLDALKVGLHEILDAYIDTLGD